MTFTIAPPSTPADFDALRELWGEYLRQAVFQVDWPKAEHDMASLPGAFAPPDGGLLLAKHGDEPVGCVALRRFDETRVEMKRLYVRPNARGTGLGAQLAAASVAGARALGYNAIVLDTYTRTPGAIRLYERLGFHETEPYCFNPEPDTRYFRLDLAARREPGPRVRLAVPADSPAIMGLIHSLGAYQGERDAVVGDEQQLLAHVFGPQPVAEVLVGLEGEAVVGFALMSTAFSVYLTRPTLTLADLFVQPAQRGTGLGKALMVAVAELAVARGYARLDFTVLDGNQLAVDFYEALGAHARPGWTNFRVDGDALTALANRGSATAPS